MNRVRWGLIGCGDIARKRVAAALRDSGNGDFVAVSRRQAELAESFAREFGARRWYADWRALLTDDEIDAVYIATPVYLHAAQTIAAAEAGKHVLCEKPMALSVAECDRMMAACRTNRVRLGVAYYRHFYPVISRIKAIIAAGEIGEPMIVQMNAFEYFNPAPDHPRAWFISRSQAGGGPMMDFGCHRIEVLLNLFGRINGIQAFTDRLRFEREVEDTSAAFFKFETGARATLTVTHTVMEGQDTLDIFGTAGSIHVPVLNQGLLRLSTAAGETTEVHPPHANLQQPLIEDFAQAVIEGREPAVGGETGRKVARIEAEIYRT
jgi:predicted dehydrogenase